MTTPEEPTVRPAEAAPAIDVLGAPEPASRTGGRKGLAAVVAAAVLVAGAGAAYAGYAVYLKPHGASPEEAVPGDALAFAKVDLDPAPSQKLAVYELAKKFPQTNTKVKSSDSIKDDLLRSAFESGGSKVKYDADIKPWVGKRIALAALPDAAGATPHPLIAILVTDHAKAEAGLRRVIPLANADAKKPSDKMYYAFSRTEGYVLISDSQAAVDGAATTSRHLSQETAYTSAVKALGGDQILTAWADAARVFAAIPKGPMRNALKDNPFFSFSDVHPTGQVVLGLHAEHNAIELRGTTVNVSSGLKGFDQTALSAGQGTNLVQGFPADSVAALSMTGLGQTVANLYTANEAALKKADAFGVFDLINHAGISLPGDLKAVLGTELAGYFAGTKNAPRAALRVKTTNPARARAALFAIASAGASANAQGPVPDAAFTQFYAPAEGGYVVGIPPSTFLVESTTGKLGANAEFRAAVPDARGASFVLYVDINRAAGLAGDGAPDELKNLQSFGMTASSHGHNGSFRMRLTFN